MHHIGYLDKSSPVVLPPKPEVSKDRMITYEEVDRHHTEEDCWVIYKDKVYDITGFLPEHPGGPTIVKKYAGGDIDEPFDE